MSLFGRPLAASSTISRSLAVKGSGRTAIASAGVLAPDLAARGLPNKDIAERLTVSVRTVEGHLYRAGLKLGVSERTALKDVLGLE